MFGSTEMIIVLVIVLVLFGGSQLPKLAKNLGKAQKEFKDGIGEAEQAQRRRSRALPRRSSSPHRRRPRRRPRHRRPPDGRPSPSGEGDEGVDLVASTFQDPTSFAFAAATPHAVLDPLVEGVLEAP